MSVAPATRLPFIGGLTPLRDLRLSEIRPEHAQGPVPEHLLVASVAEDDYVAPVLVKPVKEEPAPPKAKRTVTAPKVRKERLNVWPCPACGARSRGLGSAGLGASWRQCRDEACGVRFRTRPPRPRSLNAWPPCPACGAKLWSYKKRVNVQVLRCKACRQFHRMPLGTTETPKAQEPASTADAEKG